MKDKLKVLVNEFGKELVKKTRDETIRQIHEQVEKLTDNYHADLYNKLSNFDNEQVDTIKDIIIDSVDRTLTNFLWTMDQEERFDIVGYEIDSSCFHSLREINAGLYDEYYYFVQEFSEFKMIELKEYENKTVVEQLPDERIIALFDVKIPGAAKREFVKIMNKKEEFDILKERIHHIPPHIIEFLIELTLSYSSFHRKQCEELRKLIN